jgi:hypothetical protein
VPPPPQYIVFIKLQRLYIVVDEVKKLSCDQQLGLVNQKNESILAACATSMHRFS